MGNRRARAIMVNPGEKGVEVAEVDKGVAVTDIPNELEIEKSNEKSEER